MPLDLSDVDEFTEPVTVPEDGDDRDAASVEGTFQALANRTRYVKNLIGNLHADDHAWTGANSFAQDVAIDGHLKLADSASGEVLYANTDGAIIPRIRQRYYKPKPAGDWVRDTVFYAASTEVPSKAIELDLSDLPSGALVTEVAALVRQGADATAGAPVAIQLWRVTPSGSALPAIAEVVTTIGGSDTHTGTAATREQIEVSCLEEVQNISSILTAHVISSDVATGGSKDVVYWYRVTFTDPGPRNF